MLWEMEMLQTGEIIKRKCRIICGLLCVIIVFLWQADSYIQAKEEKNTIEVNQMDMKQVKEVIEKLINWKKADTGVSADASLINDRLLQDAGSTTGDWYPIALGRLGYEDNYSAYLSVIKKIIRERYQSVDKLDKVKATEWHRISLAILAMGGDPTNVGEDQEGNTINLIADGTYNRGYQMDIGAQGINGYIWGLITLDSMGYEVPKDAYYNREDLIKEILKRQQKNGGFSLEGEEGETDPDITAMVLQALAPYYEEDTLYKFENVDGDVEKVSVKQAVDHALITLSKLQKPDGDYASWGTENVESTAQVLIALCSLKIDYSTDKRFIKNGNNLLDGIMKYRMEDGGFTHSFQYDEDNLSARPNESNSMAGEQVLCALTALVRYVEGYHRFYDFRPEMEEGSVNILKGITNEASVVTINEDEVEQYKQLPIEVTTKEYIVVVELLDKLETATNRQEYSEMKENLEERLQKITMLKEEIEEINKEIIDKLYPFDRIGFKDWKEIKALIKRIKSLSEYDRNQITGYEDVLRMNTVLSNRLRAIIIRIVVIVFILLALTVVFVRTKARRKQKRYEKLGFYDNDEDEEE
jgi:prenyltransferase beta subunit